MNNGRYVVLSNNGRYVVLSTQFYVIDAAILYARKMSAKTGQTSVWDRELLTWRGTSRKGQWHWYEPCQECKGTGEILTYGWNGMDVVTCRTCIGSKVVEAMHSS